MSSPIILLSSFSDEQRRKLTCLVEKLGGRVLQCVVSEKLLSGVPPRVKYFVAICRVTTRGVRML